MACKGSTSSVLVLAALIVPPGIGPRAQGACDGISEVSNVGLAGVAVASGIPGRPLYVTAPPGDASRIFIVEQDGRILLKRRGDPPATWSVFLDIGSKVSTDDSEMGLLGLAFDPDYPTSGFFFVNYTETVAAQIFTVVARYEVSSTDPDLADPASELRILRFLQPESNHNGGQVLFGPDGFLYIFTGDGGGGGDLHGTCGNGQDNTALLGKILRLDVRGADPAATAPDCGAVGGNYGVPSTNPFRDGPGANCDENWAIGLRNPWRNSFDAATSDLYVADVGQNCWEEVNYVPSSSLGGQNYGWRQMEGNHCFNSLNQGACNSGGQLCPGSPPCNSPVLTDPIHEFGHTAGACSVTGGYVYRGCRMTAFLGRYFYGDFCAGSVESFEVVSGVATNHQDWTSQVAPGATLAFDLTSFGEDTQGEIYVADREGLILKIVPPFADLEVSSPGADRFRLHRTEAWTWEDVAFTTDHPVSFYRVYRGAPNGAFVCVFEASSPSWPSGGDPAAPAVGELFAYVVTAVNPSGVESRTGHPGTFDPSTCP